MEARKSSEDNFTIFNLGDNEGEKRVVGRRWRREIYEIHRIW